MILAEKQQKEKDHHQVTLINMNILTLTNMKVH